MKCLVVFYSLTGTTKKIAEVITDLLECDIEEIIDTTVRTGLKGHLVASKDALTKNNTVIKEISKDSSVYDVVIIGTPVWAFTMAPAVRTYIIENKGKFKKIAFFCTQGGMGSKTTF